MAVRDSMTQIPSLTKFRSALTEMYGERLVLYGSHARGDATGDSDYDVAVFLKDLSDRWAEADKIAITTAEILSQTGELITPCLIRQVLYQEAPL